MYLWPLKSLILMSVDGQPDSLMYPDGHKTFLIAVHSINFRVQLGRTIWKIIKCRYYRWDIEDVFSVNVIYSLPSKRRWCRFTTKGTHFLQTWKPYSAVVGFACEEFFTGVRLSHLSPPSTTWWWWGVKDDLQYNVYHLSELQC